MIEISEKKIHHLPRFLMLLSVPALLHILLLFVACFDIFAVKVETHSVIITFLILLIFMTFIMHNAWYAFANFKNDFSNMIKNVEDYINSNELSINGITKSYGNIDPFFDEHFKNIRNDNFASVAASIFPTLGILGTFVAIAISMPDFSVESKEALENEITLLLNGVGTAFYASIYGIFLSLWWIFFEKRGLTKVQKDIDKAKAYYKDKIWNEEEIKLVSIAQDRSQNEKLLDKIENLITPEFVYSLNKIAQEKIELIERLNNEHQIIEDRISQSYNKVIDLFEHTTKKQKELISSFDGLHNQVTNTNQMFEDSINEQHRYSKATKNEIYAVLSSFELISSDLKNLGRELINKDLESKKDEQK